MPQTLTPEQLEAVGGPIAAGLLPAWTVIWVLLTQEQIDALDPNLPGPNLAIVKSVPTRRIVTVYVVNPFPDGESLSSTLHHELGHAWISPITSQIADTAASVMLEEQLIETLGNYLASLAPAARVAARCALSSIVDSLAPAGMRARISARARQGAAMDPETIQKMIDALKAGDGESALKMCEEALVKAASGGAAAPTDAAPPGDAAKVETPTDATPGAPAAKTTAGPPPPMDAARAVARKGAEVETQERARVALTEIETIAKDARAGAKDGLVATLRARLPGHAGLPGIEKRILAAPTYDRAKEIADTAIEMGGGADRARSGAEHGTGPTNATGGTAAPFTAAQLEAQGLSAVQAAEIVAQHAIPGVGPKLAEQSLQYARARLNPSASPWMPVAPARKAG